MLLLLLLKLQCQCMQRVCTTGGTGNVIEGAKALALLELVGRCVAVINKRDDDRERGSSERGLDKRPRHSR
jgi:hypothetical protein